MSEDSCVLCFTRTDVSPAKRYRKRLDGLRCAEELSVLNSLIYKKHPGLTVSSFIDYHKNPHYICQTCQKQLLNLAKLQEKVSEQERQLNAKLQKWPHYTSSPTLSTSGLQGSELMQTNVSSFLISSVTSITYVMQVPSRGQKRLYHDTMEDDCDSATLRPNEIYQTNSPVVEVIKFV